MQGTDSGVVERAVERVFARPEFGEEERTLADEFFEWLTEQLDIDADPDFIASTVDWTARALLIVLGALLVWALVRFGLEFYRSQSARRKSEQEQGLIIRQRVRELYLAARRARVEGNLRTAVRMGLFALVTGLGERGAFEYRDAWTYREILRHGNPDGPISQLLSGLVEDLEAKEFGDEPIAEADLDRLEALCDEYLSGVLEAAA